MKDKKERIKVAYLLTPIEFGGAEKVSLNFLKNVDLGKFDIYPILLIRPWEKDNLFINKLEKMGYPIYKVPTTIRTHEEGRGYFRFFRCFWNIYFFLKKGSFDLLHSHSYFADIMGIPAARILCIPSISTCHGFIFNDRKLTIYNKLDLMVQRFSNKVLAVSEKIKDDLIKSGVCDSKIQVIQNAVEMDGNDNFFLHYREKTRRNFGINPDEIVLGYVGRLSEEKGLRYLVEAGYELLRSGLRLRVLIIGDGPQRTEIENFAKEVGLQKRVIFAGFKNEIEKLLASIDIFVLPSLTEGTPMALLEAMAYGIPIVATAVGGVPKVIDSGENGILVPAADPEKIAEAVLTICRDNDFRTKLSEMAKETIRSKFNINEWVRKIESVYLEVISSKRDRG